MFKKILTKLLKRKDSANTDDSSYKLEVSAPFITNCASASQFEALNRIKKARRNL